ncbi:MAG: ribonuclease E activity regulator RraA [Proteobacteria bacterium]|nr:ribonuclease E activity regulator RraA [Pseudomonadota bacterium]
MKIVTPDLCDENPETVSAVAPIFNNYGGKRAFGGEIVTVRCFEDNTVVKAQAAEDGAGKVMVVDGGGSMRCALVGDMIAANAMKNGWLGLIVYGCIRDVDAISTLDIGIQALNSMPIRSIRENRGELNIEISFGGVTFKPGEYVYADNNGVIISPQSLF